MKEKFAKLKNKFLKTQKAICGRIAVVVLFMEYLLVVIPTAFLMKMTGRDRLSFKKPDKKSYWTDNDIQDTDYERQF